ncbi:MAG: hypothetical protein ABI870_04935 [Rhodanobacter sp.]
MHEMAESGSLADLRSDGEENNLHGGSFLMPFMPLFPHTAVDGFAAASLQHSH